MVEVYSEGSDERNTDGIETAERVNRFLAQHAEFGELFPGFYGSRLPGTEDDWEQSAPESDGQACTENGNPLALYNLFAEVRYPAGQTQDRVSIPEEPIKRNLAEQQEKTDEVRGKNRFGAVVQVLQGIQSLSVSVADFSRRYLQRGSDSRKANGYDGSSLPYKMKRLNPPE